jgi:predicted TIM-barrel fold metal-dependent hydrolase
VNIPLCLIPIWDVELSVAEVQRIAAKGAHAICFSEIPSKLGLPSIHSGEWDPVFAACNDLAVTLCMHIGSSSSMPAASPDAPEAVGSALQFNNAFASMIDWLFSGKMIQFPELKLAYSEGQIGWMPYARERADRVWEMHEPWTHAKAMVPEPPSTYFKGRIFGCFTDDQHGLNSLDELGTDNICFEVDYPHSDTTWPDSKQYVEKMVGDLDAETAYKILRGNAINMLSLDRV